MGVTGMVMAFINVTNSQVQIWQKKCTEMNQFTWICNSAEKKEKKSVKFVLAQKMC